MVGAAGMAGTLISFAAVTARAWRPGLVGRVLGDTAGPAAASRTLLARAARARCAALLDGNRHLVEALRDALLERHELIGHEITDVLEARGRPQHGPGTRGRRRG